MAMPLLPSSQAGSQGPTPPKAECAEWAYRRPRYPQVSHRDLSSRPRGTSSLGCQQNLQQKRRQSHTEPTSSLSKPAPRASSPALLTPAALTLSALSAQAANGDGLGFLECPESKPEGQDSCLPGTPAPPQRPRERTADSSQTRCTDSRGPGGTWCPPTLLHCLKRPGPLKA